MRRVVFGCAVAVVFIGESLLPAPTLAGTSSRTQMDVAICRNVTHNSYPGAGIGPANAPNFGPGFDCGRVVTSPGAIFVQPDNTCKTVPGNDFGQFTDHRTVSIDRRKPFGAWIHVSAPNNCSTNPPTLGFGVGPGGAFTVSLIPTAPGPATLRVRSRTGKYGGVIFTIGALAPGTYSVTVSFPAQTLTDLQSGNSTALSASTAKGTLVVLPYSGPRGPQPSQAAQPPATSSPIPAAAPTGLGAKSTTNSAGRVIVIAVAAVVGASLLGGLLMLAMRRRHRAGGDAPNP